MTNPISPTIKIDGEHGTQHGWLFTLCIEWGDGVSSEHEITMSWVDHEHLVGGAVPPSVIAERAAKLAAAHFGQIELPERFDVSSLRRRIDNFDYLIKSS